MAKKRGHVVETVTTKTVVKKKTEKSKKKKSARKSHKASHSSNQLIVDNFVALQKVFTNLAIKFDSLSEQISKLLSLFEISAKSFAEKQGADITREDKEFLEKIDRLLEQNKLIAKGLTMMGEKSGLQQQEIRQR